LLSGSDITEEAVARLAVQERAVPVIRHIAEAGAEMDSEGGTKWRRLLGLLPATADIPEGRLPHRTRFASQSGISRINGQLQRSGRSVWLRPEPQATAHR
jgi:hypothetical protein